MNFFRELRNEKLDSKKVENFLDRMAEAVGRHWACPFCCPAGIRCDRCSGR